MKLHVALVMSAGLRSPLEDRDGEVDKCSWWYEKLWEVTNEAASLVSFAIVEMLPYNCCHAFDHTHRNLDGATCTYMYHKRSSSPILSSQGWACGPSLYVLLLPDSEPLGLGLSNF